MVLLEKQMKELDHECGVGNSAEQEEKDKITKMREEIDSLKQALNVLEGDAIA